MTQPTLDGRFDAPFLPEEALSPAVEKRLKGVLDGGGQADAGWLLTDWSCHTLAVWHRLYTHVLEQSPYEALKTEAMATLARELAERLPRGIYGYRTVCDCQALSGAELAESLLRLHRSDEAEVVLEAARRAAGEGSGRPAVHAPVAMRRGLVFRYHRQAEGAELLFEQAAELYRRLPDPVLEGVALIRRGVVLEELGRLEAAHENLFQGLRLCRHPRFLRLQRRGAQALVRLIQRRGGTAGEES